MSGRFTALLAATALAGVTAAAAQTGVNPGTGNPNSTEPNSTAPSSAPQQTGPVASGTADAANGTAPAANGAAPAPGAEQEIVVTGTAFRQRTLDTPSPVTSVSAVQLAQRGITTAADAVLSTSSSSGGGLPNNFTGNGAFAGGATGVSLRGLTTDSTLVLQDGLRLAYFPLADDGARSFVDLNTIPSSVIESVQVLKDGASATYGADAVAGVVNYIMKKQITGISGSAEGGVTQRGDGGHQRMTLTGGYGDLKSQGFNIYASVEYQHDSIIYNRDRGYPHNTNDLSGIIADDGKTPGPNRNPNGSGFAGTSVATTSAVVTPATLGIPGNPLTGTQIAGTTSMVLNPAGCGQGTVAASSGGNNYCTQNLVGQYNAIQPDQTRFGATLRGTVNVGSRAQAYLMGTYYQNRENYPNLPIRTNSTEPYSLQGLTIPAMLANGQINPQDPYANVIDAATGQRESALLQYGFGDIPSRTSQVTRNYRVSGGISGDFGDSWHYDFGGTYMRSTLNSSLYGFVNYDALTAAVNNGTYNFVDPSQNSEAVRNTLAPVIHATAKSQLWQVQGTLSKGLFELPGGTLQVAVTGQVRYEDINDPIQDPLNAAGMFAAANINTFSAIGHRYNEAGAFEIDAPVLKQLDVNVSGRYDHYSEGFSHFSPKVGVKVTPVQPLILRGTFSKGFRAPSIPETSGSVLGFLPNTLPPLSVRNAHNNDGYVQEYSLELNTAGNPDLKPETSTGFTGGFVLEPTSWLHLSVDYYHIKKKNVIVGGPDYQAALDAYYNGGTIPAGYSVGLNPADPANPNAIRTVQIVNSPYLNANSLVTSGIDFGLNVNYRLADNVRFISALEATRIQKYNISTAQGVQHFVGTVGPFQITSASGTPRWRANWQNTVTAGKLSVTGTTYFTSGYKGTADDATGPGTSGDCANAIRQTSTGVPVRCHTNHFIDVDLNVSYAVTPKSSVYFTMYNVGDAKAPLDVNTYGGVNYNPAWATAGILGRTFKVGATFGF